MSNFSELTDCDELVGEERDGWDGAIHDTLGIITTNHILNYVRNKDRTEPLCSGTCCDCDGIKRLPMHQVGRQITVFMSPCRQGQGEATQNFIYIKQETRDGGSSR